MSVTDNQKKALTRSERIAVIKEDKLRDEQYNSIVRKANPAIRNARYSLSLQQQRILCYLISKVQSSDTKDTEKIFNIKDFYDFMEVGNKDYDKVRRDLQAIRNRSWWIRDEKTGEDVLVGFFNTVRCDKRSAKVRIKWHEDMMPYIQNLVREFTQYKLWYIMTMKSEYSIRLYELLKSVAGKTVWNFKIEDLKHKFMCDSYKLFGDFKRRVIDPAVNEINEKTDINVTYELFKFGDSGKAYTDIEFTVIPKEDAERLTIDKNIRDELDGQQMFDV
ncbi:MAG: replication initiation protein [Ruminococcus sp.]|nr:replication initiation protein [Ruminococcus sp.]MCM1381777.1 replication initiation protein [Muribaculaceae bacterium]MCM1480180.1 replication initiation protein [Muribaculaceae bacterium]